jgi:ABC-type antimicrobial peptide transport system permease subunit
LQRPSKQSGSFVLVAVIVGCVAAWGLFHALGALLGGSSAFGDAKYRPDWRRAAVIVASFAAFLGGWILLLRYRANRTFRE